MVVWSFSSLTLLTFFSHWNCSYCAQLWFNLKSISSSLFCITLLAFKSCCYIVVVFVYLFFLLLVWYWLPITHSLTIYRCSLCCCCCCSLTLTDRPKWIFFHELRTTAKNSFRYRVYKILIYTSFRTCTPVPPQRSRYYDLELFPECDAKDEITEVK